MRKTKITFISIACTIGVFALIFGLSFVDLGYRKIFEPKHANIDRKVYENTKSHVYGKIQELTKYFGEYQKADDDGKEAIANIIKMNFANFDAKHINNYTLKEFLTSTRGF